uniref:Uncharacterized protein n=1 Tax=Romanomermis culicivorax TaxID=13658 RepID=A0A915J9X4_ROMCU
MHRENFKIHLEKSRHEQRLECYFCEHTESRVALPEQRDRSCFLNFSYETNIRLCASGDVCK